MPMSKDDFKKAALQTYVKLLPAFNDEQPIFFWRLGHSFDTIVDYLVVMNDRNTKDVSKLAIAKYKAGGGAWWDDFGWWAISGLKASASGFFGGDDIVFRSIALECWGQMYNNAPYGWARADQKKFKDYEPLFSGGVWNHVIDDACNPGGGDGLCGRQNTVTNGLYLVIAARLSLDPKVPHDPAYRLSANMEYGFLDQWFKIGDDKTLLKMYSPGLAYVRERVGYFKSSAVDDAYRPDLAWAGDQGLIIGGLVDRMRFVPPDEYGRLKAIASALLAGTKDYLTDADILKPWTPNGSPAGDDDDYWTGPAVFMRYLLSAYQNKDLKVVIQDQKYQDFIRANAENVVKNPDWSGSTDAVVNLTNNLAILVAAVAMLP